MEWALGLYFDPVIDWCYICGADLMDGCEEFADVWVCPICSLLLDQAIYMGHRDFEDAVNEVKITLQQHHDDFPRT